MHDYSLDAIEFIKRALKAGVGDPKEIKAMSEFDPLRDRSDFIALFH